MSTIGLTLVPKAFAFLCAFWVVPASLCGDRFALGTPKISDHAEKPLASMLLIPFNATDL